MQCLFVNKKKIVSTLERNFNFNVACPTNISHLLRDIHAWLLPNHALLNPNFNFLSITITILENYVLCCNTYYLLGWNNVTS